MQCSFSSLKQVYFRKLFIEIPQKCLSRKFFDMNYYDDDHCWREMFSHNLEKKLIKVSPKRGKIIYLYKSVNVNFFYYIQNFIETSRTSCEKVK